MPRKTRTQSRKRSAPEPTLVTSNLFGEGRRLKPFGGDTPKLVLSIDIGTTFSAASFCILKPRTPPNLEIVSAWPGQTTSDTKVPTVIYYNQSGFPVIWGAETTNEDNKIRALEENLSRAEWFKLSLAPSHLVTVAGPNTTTSSTRKTRNSLQSLPKSSGTHNTPTNPTSTLNASSWLATPGSSQDKYRPANFADPGVYSISHLPSLQSIPRSPPPLPPNIDVYRVYADFIRLMFGHIKSHIYKNYSSGTQIWNELFPTMEVVFTIPNGWEMRQRQDIRIAAVQAGLMGSTVVKDGQDGEELLSKLMNEATLRISFVSEAEAAMVYAADSGHVDSWLKAGEDIILCDAGGGTIDTTVYKIVKERPLELKEKFASKCVVAGAILVNQAAEKYITDKVKGTTWDTTQKIQQLMDEFERDTKKRFGPSGGDYGIGHGVSSEYIPEANIRSGRLYIPARDFERFFEPTLEAIKAGIKEIYDESRQTTKNVIMVGGLMNSSFAYTQLESWGSKLGLSFSKPDGPMAKAVSHGGLMWYLTKPVKAYITKFHYGTDVIFPVDEMDEEDYDGREVFSRADEVEIVEGRWHSIACMGQELNPNIAVFQHYDKFVDEDDIIRGFEFEEKIFVSREEEPPMFVTTPNGLPDRNAEHLCTVSVDLRELFNLTRWKKSKQNQNKYKILSFDMSIVNEGYDIKAFASWNVMGKEHKSPATIVLPDLTS